MRISPFNVRDLIVVERLHRCVHARNVIYANSDSSKKVTVTVDDATASDAASAYQEAVVKSKAVPGFEVIPADNLGQNAFVGTVTQGGETLSALAHYTAC